MTKLHVDCFHIKTMLLNLLRGGTVAACYRIIEAVLV